MGNTKEFERVNEGGLVNVMDEKLVGAVPLYYCHGKWFGPNRDGGFSAYKDSYAGSLLGQHGFNRSIKNDMGNTQAEVAMLWLMQNRSVNYAGPLAGYPVGAHTIGQQRILVTEELRLVEPKKGKFPTVLNLVTTLLADAEHDQVTVFLTVTSARFKHVVERMKKPGLLPFQHCPALGLFGEFQSGKSALIDLVLAPLFGGRKADPLAFLKEGKFNKDLFPAALLVLDDKGASANLEERRQRGDSIKSLIWTEFQRMEGKGVDALMVSPFWWLVIAGNFEDSSLNICPALNDSMKDKLILLKARRADGLPTTHEEKKAWVEKLRSELPAFAHFLLSFKPPKKSALDSRSRVLNFWHPDIAGALLEKQPECKALEVVDLLNVAPWKGTATEFYDHICELDKGGHHDRLFGSIDKCGRILTELSKLTPERVVKGVLNGISRYEISRAKD